MPKAKKRKQKYDHPIWWPSEKNQGAGQKKQTGAARRDSSRRRPR